MFDIRGVVCTISEMATHQRSVTDRLRELIMSGEMPPGRHLLEVPLARELGVSRTPLRTALTALAQEGLLHYRPNRGYVVRSFSLDEVLDAYVVRGMAEGLACRLAAERGLSEDSRATMEKCLAEGDAILATGELTELGVVPWRTMNERFHATILAAAGNAFLLDIAERMLSVPMLSRRVVHWYEYPRVRASHELHHLIFQAIRRRQGERAEYLMREHIHQATEIIRGIYENSRGADLQAAG